MAPKRKNSNVSLVQMEPSKKIKISSDSSKSGPGVFSSQIRSSKTASDPQKQVSSNGQPSKTAKEPRFKGKIHKLAPPKPFLKVSGGTPLSSSKSSHKDGKNVICVSRRTTLGSYLSRCKKILVEEGYDVLCLHAMGAAIPHLLKLTVSLPGILPYARSDIKIEIQTNTVEVMDELIPDNEEEDMEMNTRGKAGLSVRLQLCKANGT